VLAGLLVSGCGDSTAPAVVRCTDDTAFRVARDGNVPVFSWAGGCGIDALYVLADQRQTVDWAIESVGRNQLRSPIRYGVVPTGARQVNPPLGAGSEVFFSVWFGPADNDRVLHGVQF
jgi:hypothetical protein